MSNTRMVPNVDQSAVPETSAYRDFMNLIKIGIVNSNVMTAFTGLWLALIINHRHLLHSIDTVIFSMLGTALIIGGSCSINNFIDRDIDTIMESKRGRPSVTGRYSGTKILTIGFSFVILGLIFLALTTITAAVIGFIGVFAYVVLYSMWSKRKLVSNTIIGSFSGAVPPLIGWAAVDPHLSVLAWMLFLLMFIWQPPHFYALAMKRCEEYRAANIPMLPVVKGFEVTKRHIIGWIIFLFPVPFFMTELGTFFVVLATLFNIGWLVLGITGFKKREDLKWAKLMFVYSLNYLTILFVAMIIIALFI